MASTRRSDQNDGRPSGFFQTSARYDVAAEFAKDERLPGKGKGFGVVLVIDPKGAEVLQTSLLPNNTGLLQYALTGENEVLFGPRLNQSRIKQAVIVNAQGHPVKILNNPNYVAH